MEHSLPPGSACKFVRVSVMTTMITALSCASTDLLPLAVRISRTKMNDDDDRKKEGGGSMPRPVNKNRMKVYLFRHARTCYSD